MEATIGSGYGNGNGDESTKSVGRESFVGGGSRCDDRCVFRSAVVGGETQLR